MLATKQRIGDYEVETKIGSGGFATVFRVRSVRDGARYALKVLDPEHRKHEDRRMRFLDEARIQAQRLDHPNIVKVVEIVSTAQVAGLILEYVDGGDLDDLISSRSELPTYAEFLELALPLLDALGHAHRNGIIHRDLKPANILIAEIDGVRVPKVTDFGVAKVLNDSAKKQVTATRAQIGTLGYMSPEQIKSPRDVTHESDIFSLGAVLYELAVGSEPFAGGSDYEVMDNVVNARYRRAVVTIRHLPESVAEAIDRALSPAPGSRFDSCGAFARALCSPASAGSPARHELVPPPAPGATVAAPPRASATLRIGRPVIPLWIKLVGVAGMVLGAWGLYGYAAGARRPKPERAEPAFEPALPSGCTFDGLWTLRFYDAPGAACPLPNAHEVQFVLRQRGDNLSLTDDPYGVFGNVTQLGGDMDRHHAQDSCTVFATTELRGERIHFSVTESKGMLNGWAQRGEGHGRLDDGECTIGGSRKKGQPAVRLAPALPTLAHDDDDEHISLDFLSLSVGVPECDEFFARTVACLGRRDELRSATRRIIIERVEKTRRDIDASNAYSHVAVCRQSIRETQQALKTPCAR